MKARLVTCGRFSFLAPRQLGRQFEDQFTIHAREPVKPSAENGWKRGEFQLLKETVWWDDRDVLADNEPVFCFFAGYTHRVLQALRGQGVEVTLEDRRPNGLPAPDFSQIAGLSFRGRQLEGLMLGLARSGVVICPTGWGKSFLCRQIARLYPAPTKGIITAPSATNTRDLYNALKDLDYVGMVGDGTNKPNRVTCAVTHSLHLCDPQVNWLICDEAHMACTPMHIKALNRFPRAKFLGLTATPEGRSDGRDPFLEALFGPVLIDIPYQEAVETGNVVQIEVRLLWCDEGPDVQGRDDIYRFKLGYWRNAGRNRQIAQAVQRVRDELGDPQILIMVDKTEHAYALGQFLPDFAVVTGDTDADSIKKFKASGALTEDQVICNRARRIKYQKEFTCGALRGAIATKVWSRGVDFKDLNVLIRADGAPGAIDAGQIPGRLSRLGSDGKKAAGLLIQPLDTFSRDLLGRSLRAVDEYRKHKWPIEHESELLRKQAVRLYKKRPGQIAGQGPDGDFED